MAQRGPQEALLGGLCLTVTISSKFRIESLLSPAEPEAEEQTHVSTTQPVAKRKHADAFVSPGAAPLALDLAASLDGRSQTSARSDTGSDTGRAYTEDGKPLVLGSRKDAAKLARLRPPMRSSIACLRCRRSKIKCDNDGGNSPCETCIKAGQDCQYPDGAPARARRSEILPSNQTEREEAQERKRIRRLDNVPGADPERAKAYAAEVLSYPFLTSQVWDKVFAIYKLHFTAELPFIHLATLKDTMSRTQEYYRHHPNLNVVLLGLLALAAPFYPELAKYSAHVASLQGIRPRDPLSEDDRAVAGDFFANALVTALGPLRTSVSVATVERVQALLILSLYEWNRRQEGSAVMAWTYLGLATRLAHFLKLGLDDRLLLLDETVSRGASTASMPTSESIDAGVTKEVRRRTMFSCLILDRMLACGKDRPPTIRSEDLEIQLPCPELSFDLSHHANTGFLRTFRRDQAQGPTDSSVLSLFIQLSDIWGEITKYSVGGGRFLEEEVSTTGQTRFLRLQEELDYCTRNLPGTFTLSRQNYYRHDNHQAASMYVSLHMLISACQVVLHREYMSFIPSRPWKGRRSSSTTHDADDFQESCARRVFQAARDVVDLTEICRDKLPMTPLTLFATWTAGFVGIYAHHFPHMDNEQSMSGWAEGGRPGNEEADVHHGSLTGLAHQAMLRMVPYLNSADVYLRAFKEIDTFYGRITAGHVGLERLSIRTGSESGPRDGEGSTGVAAQPSTPSRGGRGSTSHPQAEKSLAFTAINSPATAWQSRQTVPQHEMGSLFDLSDSLLETTRTRGRMWATIRGTKPLDNETMTMLESQRIGAVLNDLQEFAGAGALGDVESRERTDEEGRG
ncbi:transcriptional regulatory protein [Paramyrothecium foliicola]|nr:transcriptional regulatory protein [Paramyrothecium foliicola]